MWLDPSRRYHFKLHYCEQDNHYHILLGPDNISWPVWSLVSAVQLVDFTQGFMMQGLVKGEIGQEKMIFNDQELDRLREEIRQHSYIRRTGPNGEQLSEFLMPRERQPQEGNVAVYWRDFFTGRNPYMCYTVDHILGTDFLPLYCDFIHRDDERPKEVLTPDKWLELAKKPVIRKTMEELGIGLDPAD